MVQTPVAPNSGGSCGGSDPQPPNLGGESRVIPTEAPLN